MIFIIKICTVVIILLVVMRYNNPQWRILFVFDIGRILLSDREKGGGRK